MSSLAEGRRNLIKLLKDSTGFSEAVRLITSLSHEHGASIVAGVFEKVIDRCGDEHREAQTGRRGMTNFLLRIGIGSEQIVCTYTPVDVYELVANRFLAIPPHQHTEPEQVMGIGHALKEDGPHFARLNLRSKLLRHVLIAALYYDIFPLAGIWGPSVSAHRGRTDSRRKVLNRIVEDLLKCRMTLVEIQQQFIDCLKFKSESRSIDFVLKLASAKCFPDGQVHQELSEVLRQHYFNRFWDGIVSEPHKHGGDLLPFGYLARAGMVETTERTEIEASLTELLATGMFRQALEIVTHIGEQLGLYHTQNHPGFCVTKGPVACHRECVIRVMQNLSYKAFHIASGESQWGHAASLVLNLGCDHLNLDTDGGNEVVRRALEHNQPIPVHLFDFYST